MESEFHKIIRKTGKKPVQCKCQDCKKQCSVSPCLGTPSDIEKIIDAGHGDKIFLTHWAAGILLRATKDIVRMYQANNIPNHGCVFFKDGLCELHEKGLKPTEGRLSHHSQQMHNLEPRKSIGWNVAKTWLDPENAPTISRIQKKLKR